MKLYPDLAAIADREWPYDPLPSTRGHVTKVTFHRGRVVAGMFDSSTPDYYRLRIGGQDYAVVPLDLEENSVLWAFANG